MHILIIPSWYPRPDNPIRGIFFREQAEALSNAGYQVGVIAPPQLRSLRLLRRSLTGWPHRVACQVENGIPVYRYHGWALPRMRRGNRYLWMRAGQVLFRRYVAEHGTPHIVHAHSALMGGVLAAALKRRYSLPYVLTEHSSAYARGRIRSWEVPLIKEALSAADERIFVSPHLGELLESLYGRVARPWVWIPNMVNSMFGPAPEPGPPQRSGPFRFLHVALMNENKGQSDLLKAFARRFKGDLGVQLRIGGDGPISQDLEQLSQELGLSGQVVFLGMLSRQQVVAEMQSADAFVLSSHYETFGAVVIEALACGKPVVATACGGPSYTIHKGNGLLVPPKDVDRLAQAMADLRDNISSYDSNAIRADCLSRFGEEAVVARLSDLYEGICAGSVVCEGTVRPKATTSA